MGSQKCFEISKNALGSQNILDKFVDIVDTVDIIESVHAVVIFFLENIFGLIFMRRFCYLTRPKTV